MKKSFLILLITAILFAFKSTAQTDLYYRYLKQGIDFYNKSEYLTALERFDLAYEFAKTDMQRDEVKKWKNKSGKIIRKQQIDLKNALAEAEKQKQVAEQEKLKAQKALEEAKKEKRRAKQMQKNMETAVFDRAAKDVIPGWTNADVELFEPNYEKIKNLNLSFSGLSRIPSQVYFCKSLESINLIGNDLENWDKVFIDLSRLRKLKDIKISIHKLDSIPSKHRKRVTGVKMKSKFLMELPAGLFLFKELIYLDLSGSWYKPRQYEARDITMSDYEKQRRNLPPEIGNLVRLETLDLRGNGLTKLPVEIGKLENLTELYLNKTK